MKAKEHPREHERLHALRSFGILDTEPDPLFDDLVAFAAELLEMPVALVSLVDADRQWFKSRVGFEPCQTTLEESFCAHALLEVETLVVEDATDDPRFMDNPLVRGRGDGERPVRFYAGAPLITAEGLPLGTLCVLDHRPRRFGERERRVLERLRDQAMALFERRLLQLESERRSRFKSDFLAHVSHEIRTPLAAVLGYAELLEGTLGRTSELETVRTIRRNGEHLRSIVDDLLDLSRIEAGQLEIDHAPCALEPLLGDVLELLRVHVTDKALAFRIDCHEALPVAISTDALRLRQILINLVGNALKFTERGEVVLELSSRESGAWLEFAVRDTGAGMSAEQLGRVFEPFRQADSDTANRFGGFGLGLPISRELARLLGGELLAESREGAGSVFRLRVPCEALGTERRVPVPRAAGASRSAPRADDVLGGRRLLVADDREDGRRLAERHLAAAGADVLCVGGGERALELLRRTVGPGVAGFDALVLDLRMPGTDGFAVLAALRVEAIGLPVLVHTADALQGQRERCIAAGCRDYLPKPASGDELVRAVAGLFTPGSPRPRGDASAGEASADAVRPAVRVLVVDDNVDLTDALRRLLSRQGFQVEVANDGREALASAERRPPHCVVLDHRLPDIDSPALLEALRAREGPPRSGFISLSGDVLDETERGALGFDRYLLKPVSAKVLVAAIEDVLR